MSIDFTPVFIVFTVIGVAIGAVLVIGVPALWHWVKPFIHMVTA